MKISSKYFKFVNLKLRICLVASRASINAAANYNTAAFVDKSSKSGSPQATLCKWVLGSTLVMSMMAAIEGIILVLIQGPKET